MQIFTVGRRYPRPWHLTNDNVLSLSHGAVPASAAPGIHRGWKLIAWTPKPDNHARRRRNPANVGPKPAGAIVAKPDVRYVAVSLLRADSRQHVRRILWPGWRRSATMGVLKSVEPTGFLAFAPAFAGINWADVNRRIIQNCPHGRGRVLSSPACLVPALPA
jgi:hypothetical protein